MANQNTPDYEAMRKVLYDRASKKLNLGTYEEFNKRMENPENRRRFHEKLGRIGKVDDFDAFEAGFGYNVTTGQPAAGEVNSGAANGSAGTQEQPKTVANGGAVAPASSGKEAGTRNAAEAGANGGDATTAANSVAGDSTKRDSVQNVAPIKADSAGVAAPVVGEQPTNNGPRGLNSPLETFANKEQAAPWAARDLSDVMATKESVDEQAMGYEARPTTFNDMVTQIGNEYGAESDSLSRQVDELNAAADSLNAKYPNGRPSDAKGAAQFDKDVKQYNDSVEQFKANANAFDEKVKNDKRMQQVNPLSARYSENGGWTYEQEQKMLELQEEAQNEHKETKGDGAKTKAFEDAAMEATGIYEPKAAVKAFEDYQSLQIANNTEGVASNMAKIYADKSKQSLQNNYVEKRQFAFGAGAVSPNSAENARQMSMKEYATEAGQYAMASIMAEDALRHIKNYQTVDSQRGQGWAGNAASGLANTAVGFGQKITDLSNWDFGISDLQQNMMIAQASEKFANDEPLTDGEQAILDAAALNMAIKGSLDTGLGFKAGEVTAYSIPMMLEMCINPASTLAENVGARVARYAMKKLGQKGITMTGKWASRLHARTLTKRAIQGTTQLIANEAAGAAMSAAPTQIAKTLSNVSSNDVEYIKGNVGSDGIYHAEEISLSDDSGFARLMNGIALQSGENSSEIFGTTVIDGASDILFDIAGRYLKNTRLGKIAGAISKKISTTDAGRFFGRMTNSQYWRSAQEFRKRAHLSGIGGEFGEEIFGGLRNAVLGVEGQLTSGYDENGNWQNGVFSMENYNDTFMTLIPMQVMFGMLGVGGYGLQSASASREKKGAIGQMRAAFYDGHQPYIDMIDSFSDKTFGEELKKVLEDPSLGMEQRTALLRYATATQFWRGTKAAMDADKVHDIHEKVFGDAYQKGYDMTDPEERRLAYTLLQNDSIDWQRSIDIDPVFASNYLEYVKFIKSGDYAGLFKAMTEDGCTERARKDVERYITSLQIVKGINVARNDEYQSQLCAASAEVGSISNSDGYIHEVETPDGKHGYMVQLDGQNAQVKLDDGTIEPHLYSSLALTQPIKVSDVMAEKMKTIDEAYDKESADMDGVVYGVTIGEDLSKYGIDGKVSAVNGNEITYAGASGNVGKTTLVELNNLVSESRINSDAYRSVMEARSIEDETLMPMDAYGEQSRDGAIGAGEGGLDGAADKNGDEGDNGVDGENAGEAGANGGQGEGGAIGAGEGGAGAVQMSAEMRALLDGYPVLYNNGTQNVWMHLGNGQKEEDGAYLVEFFLDEELSDSVGTPFMATMQQIEGMLHPDGVETPEQKAEREKAEKEAAEAAKKAEEEERKRKEEEEAARKKAEEEAAKKAAEEEEARRQAEKEANIENERNIDSLLDLAEKRPETAAKCIEKIDTIVSGGYTLTDVQSVKYDAIKEAVAGGAIGAGEGGSAGEAGANGGEGGTGGRKSTDDSPEKPSGEKKQDGGDKPDGEKPKPVHKDPNFGKSNTLFTEQRKNDALERIRKRRQSRLNSGLDPQDLIDFITIAGYCFEAGARKIADFARAMIVECEDEVRPYIKQIYMAAKHDPVIKENLGIDRKEFSSEDEVDDFDLDSIDVEERPSEQPVDGADEEEEREEKYAEGYDKLPADKNGIRSGDTFVDKNGHYRTLVCYIGGKATVWVYDKDGKPITDYVSKKGEVSKSVKDGKWTRINPNTNDATWEIHVKAVEKSIEYFDEEPEELSEEDKRRIAWAKKSLKEKIAEIERRGILDSSAPVTAKEAALWLIAKGFTLTTDAFERDFPQLLSSKARDNAKYMRWKDDKNGAKSLQAIAEGAWSDYPEYIQTKYDDHEIYLELSGMELDSSSAVDELDRMTRQEDERDTEEYRQMVENHGFTDDEMEDMFEILNEISRNDEGNLSQEEINIIFADAYDEEMDLIDAENNMWADAAYEREQQEKNNNDGEGKGVQGLAGQSGLQVGSEGVDKVGGTEGVSKEGGNTQSDGSRKEADTKGNDGSIPSSQVFGGVSKEELDSEEAKRIHEKWEDKRKNLEEQKKNVLAEKNKKRREIVGRSELANSLFGDVSDTSGNLFDNNEAPEDYSDNTIKDAMRPFDEKIADIDKQIEDSYRLEKEEIAALGTQTVIKEDAKEEDKKKEEKPEKKELTVEDIDNIPDDALSPTLKTLAKAYITGDASARANAFNQLAYLKAEQYVRNQSGNVPADSRDASGSDAVAQGDNGNGGRGDGGRGGIESQPVDNQPVQQPTGSKGSEGSVPTASGEGGDSHVAPEKPSDGTARGGQRRAGGTDRNEGGHVSRPENTGGGSPTASTDGVGSNPAKSVDHKQAGKDKFKAALDKFKKAGKDSNNRANLDLIKLVSLGTISVDQLEPMMEMAGALVEMGYGYVESGIRNFARFIDQFREDGVYGMLKDDVQLTDGQVESFIQDAWNSPYEMNGETFTISQWAQKMSDEALRESIKTSLEDKLRLQREAENVEAKIYDLDNIRATLPYLLPAQQEDVWKAETQFFNPTHSDREHAGGKGIMFTNGTGTGKTYTGLGIVKRFIKQGKGRILILTPSAEKVGDWIEDAKNLGIDLRSLEEPDEVDTDENGKKRTPTTRKGKGAVITTFANFRANQALLEDDFDLVMYDESHKIMESKNATKTSTTRQHFLMTNKDYESAMERLKAIHPLWIRENDINGRIKEIGETETNLQKILRADDIYPGWRRSWNIEFLESEKSSASSKETRDAINSYLSLLKEKGELEKELEEIKKLQPAELAKMTPRANEAVKKTKVVFLSATPFNTRDNLDYAEGYIFSYPEEDPNTKGSRNHRSGRDLFYEKHFGSSVTWKYGKQQKRSDSNEDLVTQQEMAFAEYLMSMGTMSTRQIDNGYDYSRDFPIMNVVEAAAFNDAMEDMLRDKEISPLRALSPLFDYQAMSVLFETMKVAAVLPRIREHIALGRKIVVFHRRVTDSKNLAQPPFAQTIKNAKAKVALLRMDHNAKSQAEANKIEKAIDAFMDKYSRLLDWEKKLDYRMPRQQLAAAFGDTKEYTPEEAMSIAEAQENAGTILSTKKNAKASAELGVNIANVVETEFEAYDIIEDYRPALEPQTDYESEKEFAARKKAHADALKTFNENKKAAKEAIKKRFEERIAAGEVEAPKLDKNGRLAKKVGYFAGQDSKTEKHADVEAFNDDDSEMKVIVIQEASGKEGISLHDKTGNHQRVIMQLALPQSPIAFIQIEGRIYRIGQASNAIFEYPLLGINLERTIFTANINGAASTTENLAMGEQARALKQSIMRGVLEHSGNIPVEGQGVGGKEFDTRTANKETGFDGAIKDYYGNQKMQSGRANHDNDYYPTPEPLGYKMIEWLDLQEGENVMEPSAGHGAIARYVPQENPMLAVEIGNKQFGDLAIITGAAERGTEAARGKSHLIINADFMELSEKGNTFDCVVMNPPYGVGGKEAMAHLEKAWKHLRNGGRLIAIIPDGPAMGKRLEQWLSGERDMTDQEINAMLLGGEEVKSGQKVSTANGAHFVADIHLPSVTFGRAGTGVKTRVIVLDKQENKKVGRRIDLQGKQEITIDEKAKVDDLFEEIREMKLPKRIIDPAAKAEKAVEKFMREVSHNEALKQSGRGEEKESDVYIYNRGGSVRALAMSFGNESGSIWKLMEIVYMRGSRGVSYADLPLETIAKPTKQLAEMYMKAKRAIEMSAEEFYNEYWTKKDYVQEAKDLISAWMKMIRKGSGLTENQLERLSNGEDVYVPVELKPGIPITMQKIRELFEGANTDERRQVIFDKVFNIANTLGLKLRYQEMGASTPAAYQGNGVLLINPKAWSRADISYSDKATTLLHELIHAVTQYAIERYNKGGYLPENLRNGVKKLEAAFEQAKKGGIYINALPTDERYFLHDLHEFAAEAGSNMTLRAALKKTNIWKMIKDGIKMLLGFKEMSKELAKTVGAEQTDILKEAEEALDEILDNFDMQTWEDYTAEQEIAFNMSGDVKTSFRIREKPAPKKTGKGYKVFVLKNGKLYPPMVANPNGADTPVGVWLDADAAPIAGTTKTGRNQVKAGGKGTQGGSGTLSYRPGWHLGVIPYAKQFNRKNEETGERELFPNNFVWAEVEYADDVDYQQEAHDAGVNSNGKYQHSLAGLQRLPEDGSYMYRTNPDPTTDPWVITGAMKVTRILKPSEVDQMVRDAGREPQPRQDGAVTDEQIDGLNKSLGLDGEIRFKKRKKLLDLGSPESKRFYKIAGELTKEIGMAVKNTAGLFGGYNIEGQMVSGVNIFQLDEVIDGLTYGGKEVRGRDWYEAQNIWLEPALDTFISESKKLSSELGDSELKDIIDDLVEKAEYAKTFYNEMARGNDVLKKGWKRPAFRRSDGRFSVSTERPEIDKAIDDTARSLNAKVKVVKNYDGLPPYVKEAFKNGTAIGYYDVKTGEVVLNAPFIKDADDAVRTVLHEVLGHRGLRAVFGQEAYDKKMHELFNLLPAGERMKVVEKALQLKSENKSKSGYRAYIAEAMDEYLAEAAENGAPEDISWFDKAVAIFKDMLRALGINVKLTTDDVAYMLWKSGNALKKGKTPWDKALRDVKMQKKYGTGLYDVNRKNEDDPNDPSPNGGGPRGRLRVPNDRPSALTPQQLSQVKSKEFKDWFGDWENDPENASKVVNEDGTPKVVYHGTTGNFTVFDIEKFGKTDGGNSGVGFYFSPKERFASYYAKDEGKVIPAYLDIKNPYHDYSWGNNPIPDSCCFGRTIDETRKMLMAQVEEYAKQGADKDTIKGYKEQIDTYIEHVTPLWEEINSHDGVISYRKNGEVFEYLAKSPTQIKSATENVGTFDGSNPDIRFMKRSDKADNSEAGQFYAEWNKGILAAIDEAWHDMLRSINGLQKAVTKQSGEKLEDFQNAYLMAMHLSSKNKAERDKLLREHVEPLFEFMGEFIKTHKTSKEELEKYLIAKHAKERNEVFAKRDADRAMEKAGLEQTDPDYPVEWQKAYDEYRKKDYAGLTETFREPSDMKKGADLPILEARAEKFYNYYENRIGSEDIDTLWHHIHGLSEYTLKKSYESGMMSRQTYDKVKSQFEWYVPLRGWKETTAGELYDYLDDDIQREALQQTLKNAYGRKSQAGDILETMCAMAHSAFTVGNKNMVKQAMLRLAEGHPTPLMTVTKMWYIRSGKHWVVAELPEDASDEIFDGKPYKDMRYEDMSTEDKADFISTWEEDMKSMKASGQTMESSKGLRISTPITDAQLRQHQVRVRRNGKEYIININGNPKAAQAINGKLNTDSNPNWFDRITGVGNRMISRMYTSMNPEFLFRNIQRDFMSAVNVSGAKYGSAYAGKLMNNFRRVLPIFGSTTSRKYGGYTSAESTVDTILGIGALYTKMRNGTLNESNEMERLFKEFIENGGETGYSQLWTVDDYEKRMKAAVKSATRSTGGKVAHAPFAGLHALATGISNLNEVFENATRFAVYMTSRQEGKSILQSVNDAKEASTNFNKKGSGALGNRLFRDLFVFMNASIQGTMRYVEMLAGRDHYTNDTAIKKNLRMRALASLSVTIGLGAMTTVLNYMMAAAFIGDGDDDDKKKGIEKDLINPYWRIGDYKRRNNLLIYTGSKSSMLTISLGVEEAAAYGIGCIMAERALGHNLKHNMMSDVISQVSRISPFGSFDPEKFSRSDMAGKTSEIASHIIGSYPKIYLDAFLTNRDFMGNDISYRTTYNENKPEYHRVTRGTPEYQIRWSERLYDQYGIDVNPNIADYIIKNNFGGLYSFPKKLFEFIYHSIDAAKGEYNYSNEEIPIGSVFTSQIDANWQMDRALRAEFDWYKYDIDRIDMAMKELDDKNKSDVAKERLKERIKNDDAYAYWKAWRRFEKDYNSAMKSKDWAKVDKIRMRYLKRIEKMEAAAEKED